MIENSRMKIILLLTLIFNLIIFTNQLRIKEKFVSKFLNSSKVTQEVTKLTTKKATKVTKEVKKVIIFLPKIFITS